MPEVTFNVDPGPTSRGTGDAYATETAIGGVPTTNYHAVNNNQANEIIFGELTKQTGLTHGYLKYITTVPSNATINKAKLTYTSVYTDSTYLYGIGASIRSLTPDNRWSEASVTDLADNTLAMSCLIKNTSATVAAEGATYISGAPPIAQYPTTTSGGATNHGQVLKNTSSGVLGSAEVHMIRNTVTDAGKNCWAEIWSVTGSSGEYQPDTLLATSDTITYDSVQTVGIVAATSFTFSSGDQITLPGVGGDLWILRVNQDFTTDSSFYFVTYWNAAAALSPATYNGIRQGTFGAFNKQLYPSGIHLHGIPEASSDPYFWTPLSSAGVSYTWGSSGYSPSFTTDHVENAVQALVNHSDYNGAIGLRLRTFELTNGFTANYRAWVSENHPTLDSPTLTVDWTLPIINVSATSTVALTASSSPYTFLACTDEVSATQPANDNITAVSPGPDMITAVKPDDDSTTASSGCD